MSESASRRPESRSDAPLLEPFARSLESFLTDLAEQRGLSSHTGEAYRRDLRRYLRDVAALGRRGPGDVTADDVADYLGALRSGGLSPATVARSASAIRRYHGFLLTAGLSNRDPSAGVTLRRIQRRPPVVLSQREVEKLLAATDGSDPLVRRDRAVLELLYAAGLKASELVALELEHVMTDAGLVRVAGRGGRDRLVPLGRPAVGALETYRCQARPHLTGPESGATFFLTARGKQLSRMTVWKIIRAAARRAGLERPVSPHGLRHTFAAHLLDGGADLRDVQQLLGHADISTTRIYAAVDEGRLRHVHRAYHPRGS